MALQPDPLSPQAQAILDAPDQPRLTGELTAERAVAIRESQAASRRITVDAVAAELGLSATWVEAAGVRVVELHAAPERRAPTGTGHALYLHGGGFTSGLAHDMTSVLMADRLGVPVVSVDYAYAPEEVFPVAIDQATEVYRALTAQRGGPWVAFGVSAGANLALGMVQRLRAAGDSVPLALGLFTPWADLTGNGDSRAANDGRDPVLRWPEQLPHAAGAYAGATPLDDPLVSPIYAAYDAEFPPSIITTGTRDLFLSDCTRLYWRLRRAGARAELRVWENLWHAFNTQHAVPEAAEARREVAEFLLAALGASVTP
ncbi:MAG: alpha/beta hydrolase fold domain-containing protein [Solirubrobacteraceae bacterium]|nr:alpha/beta hydrolase fold domain-containing protein [Solirubrobacteraceae bacterium]